jgi:hypothetical protein
LWAIEVLSSIDKIFNPADFNARIEVSRPFPRPFITTSTFPFRNPLLSMPHYEHFERQMVYFYVPFKTRVPEEAQQIVFLKYH